MHFCLFCCGLSRSIVNWIVGSGLSTLCEYMVSSWLVDEMMSC